MVRGHVGARDVSFGLHGVGGEVRSGVDRTPHFFACYTPTFIVSSPRDVSPSLRQSDASLHG